MVLLRKSRIYIGIPTDRHDSHNYLLFCPENKVSPGGNQKKYRANLANKKIFFFVYT